MSRIHFDRGGVETLLAHSEAAPGQRLDVKSPCLLLVAHHGIFLMSNGLPRIVVRDRDGEEEDHVVYAQECNPMNMLHAARLRAQEKIIGPGLFTLEPFSVQVIRDALATHSSGAPLALEVTERDIGVCFVTPGMRPRRGMGQLDVHTIDIAGNVSGALHKGDGIKWLNKTQREFLKGALS